MIAGSGDLSLQAQAGTLQMAAQQDLTLQSATGPIKFQAAKRIVIANSHGSRITLADGKIVIECPGTYTVHASTKSLVGPQQASVALPRMPRAGFEFVPAKLSLQLRDIPGDNGLPLAHVPWEIVLLKAGSVYEDQADYPLTGG